MSFICELAILSKVVWNLPPIRLNGEHPVMKVPQVEPNLPHDFPKMILEHQGWGVEIQNRPARVAADKIVRNNQVWLEKGGNTEAPGEAPRHRIPENGLGLVVTALLRVEDRQILKLNRKAVQVPELVMYATHANLKWLDMSHSGLVDMDDGDYEEEDDMVYKDPRANLIGIPPSGLPAETHDTLFAALKQSYLTYLDLSFNGLSDKQAALLMKSLPFELRTLQLAGNGITDQGAEWMIRLLPRRTRLQYIDLSYNPLQNPHDVLEAFEKAICAVQEGDNQREPQVTITEDGYDHTPTVLQLQRMTEVVTGPELRRRELQRAPPKPPKKDVPFDASKKPYGRNWRETTAPNWQQKTLYWNKKLYREHGLLETFWSGHAGVNSEHQQLPAAATVKGPVSYRPTLAQSSSAALPEIPPAALNIRTMLDFTNHTEEMIAKKREQNRDPITGTIHSKRKEMDFDKHQEQVDRMRKSRTIQIFNAEKKAQRRIARGEEVGGGDEEPDSPVTVKSGSESGPRPRADTSMSGDGKKGNESDVGSRVGSHRGSGADMEDDDLGSVIDEHRGAAAEKPQRARVTTFE